MFNLMKNVWHFISTIFTIIVLPQWQYEIFCFNFQCSPNREITVNMSQILNNNKKEKKVCVFYL